jgi:hypothetical protein
MDYVLVQVNVGRLLAPIGSPLVADFGHIPTVSEAEERVRHLRAHGPNRSPNRSADSWPREPTATATPESVSRRSAANEPRSRPFRECPTARAWSPRRRPSAAPVSVVSLLQRRHGAGGALDRSLSPAPRSLGSRRRFRVSQRLGCR